MATVFKMSGLVGHKYQRCKVSLMKKFKELSLPIFGLLKATKLLECCEVCPSWLTEKAQKYRVKAKSSQQAQS